jgi:hypothetical protein
MIEVSEPDRASMSATAPDNAAKLSRSLGQLRCSPGGAGKSGGVAPGGHLKLTMPPPVAQFVLRPRSSHGVSLLIAGNDRCIARRVRGRRPLNAGRANQLRRWHAYDLGEIVDHVGLIGETGRICDVRPSLLLETVPTRRFRCVQSGRIASDPCQTSPESFVTGGVR